MSNSQNSQIDFVMWPFNPSMPAAIIMTIVFIGLTAYHTFALVKTRKWFCIPFVVGGVFEIIGYAARAAAHNNTERKMPYIIQSIFLLVAPPLFAASIYMILGRIMAATKGEQYSILPARWVTKIFVCCDAICFLTQMGGGGIQASASGNPANFKTGEDVTLGGLILQIVVFLFFLAVAATFHYRMQQRPTAASHDPTLNWRRLMWILYGVSVIITLRNLVRVVEYAQGSHGYLLSNEWVIYVFDGLLMAVTLAVCTMWYRSNLRPTPKSIEEAYTLETDQPKSRV